MKTMKVNDELCDRVIHAIGRDTDPLAALNALADALGFQLSLLTCPDCRKQAAHAFTQIIPDILEHANALAADYAAAGAQERSVQAHMCH